MSVPIWPDARGSPFCGSAECVERFREGIPLAVADYRREANTIAI